MGLLRRSFSLTTIGALTCVGIESALAQLELPISTNIPAVVSTRVVEGQTEATIRFPIVQSTTLRIELFIPIDGATFILTDPNGSFVLDSNNPAVVKVAGSELDETKELPGFWSIVGPLSDPLDGDWELSFRFASIISKTVILATIYADSPVEIGLASAKSTYFVGEAASISLLILEDTAPVTDLRPVIQIERTDPPGATLLLNALDNGRGADRIADDGMYSVLFEFEQEGTYAVQASVLIAPSSRDRSPSPLELIAIERPVDAGETKGAVVFSTEGCADAVEAIVDVNVVEEGDYAVSARLSASNGNFLVERERFEDVVQGPDRFRLLFTSDAIRTGLAVDGPYELSDLLIVKLSDTELLVSHEDASAILIEDITLRSLCRDSVEVLDELEITTELANGFIDSVSFTFPIFVKTGGIYSVSIKVVGGGGMDVVLLAENRTLVAGENEISFTAEASHFLGGDGPYRVIGVLVRGPSGDATLSEFSNSLEAVRWQFNPVVPGDLDNDGDVDAADRATLLQFRNIKALSPGDRRDVFRDGRIDIRDARYIRRLRW